MIRYPDRIKRARLPTPVEEAQLKELGIAVVAVVQADLVLVVEVEQGAEDPDAGRVGLLWA